MRADLTRIEAKMLSKQEKVPECVAVREGVCVRDALNRVRERVNGLYRVDYPCWLARHRHLPTLLPVRFIPRVNYRLWQCEAQGETEPECNYY